MSEKVTCHPAIWGGKKLAYPNVPPDGPKFSASVVAGNLIFISGCQGANDETMQVETHVFEGFDPRQVAPDNMGLKSMRERASEAGALLTVESEAGRGTKVVLHWPAKAHG